MRVKSSKTGKKEICSQVLFAKTQPQGAYLINDRQRVYTQVLQSLKKLLVGQAQSQVVTLAMMISGIVSGKKAQLAAMSTESVYPAKDKSNEKRMQRWVKSPRVETNTYFLPFAEGVLAGLAQHTLVLVLDSSVVGRGCMVLMVGVVYHQRAIPLAWVVYKGKKGHAAATTHIQALQQVLPLIPAGSDVVLLGDGEYDTIEMLSWVEIETNWAFVCRTASDTLFCAEEEWLSLANLSIAKGKLIAIPDVLFTAQAYGPLQVIAWWGRAYEHPLYLVTNLELAQEACRFYQRRYRIETLFSDKKSRGFHIHKSHLSHPLRLANLLIATSLAYLWIVYLGVETIRHGFYRLIDRTDRRDKSLFRLGLDWLTYLLKHSMPIPIEFLLPLSLKLDKCVR